jgi:hypothetical protein
MFENASNSVVGFDSVWDTDPVNSSDSAWDSDPVCGFEAHALTRHTKHKNIIITASLFLFILILLTPAC